MDDYDLLFGTYSDVIRKYEEVMEKHWLGDTDGPYIGLGIMVGCAMIADAIVSKSAKTAGEDVG